MNPNFSSTIEKRYQEYKRGLPWGESVSPYVTWISEIILQQTRVAQRYGYFARFMKRSPDVATLARAGKDETMKYWQGLGYYSHVCNLHATAKGMNGAFPRTYPEVRALKGVGGYTTATIRSFTYNTSYAVVDGNVYQAPSRYLGINTPIGSAEGKKLLAAVTDELLDKRNPALYNRAIMDLGATQCLPQSPNCMLCPLASGCSALVGGTVTQLPVKQHKTKTTNRYLNYVYVRMNACTSINKRTGNDIWKNLSELLLVGAPKVVSEEKFPVLPEFRAMSAEGETSMIGLVCRDVKHALSHRAVYANFYMVNLPESSQSFTSYQKIEVDELKQYTVSRLVHAFTEECIN